MYGPNGLPLPAQTGTTSLPSRFVLHVCPIMPFPPSLELRRFLGRLALSEALSGQSCIVVVCSTFTESPPIGMLMMTSVFTSGKPCTGGMGAPKWFTSAPQEM